MLFITVEIARGLAALAIFLFHIQGLLVSLPILQSIASFGDLGVPLFFVISGYCMSASAKEIIRRQKASREFLKRRILRIYPTFLISILVVLIAPYGIEIISSLKTGQFVWPSNLRWHALDLVDWIQITTLTRIFFNQGGNLQGAFSPVNSVYWFLAILLQMYLVVFMALNFRKFFFHIIMGITFASALTFIWPAILNTGLFIGWWPVFALGMGLHYLLEKNISPSLRLGEQTGRRLSLAIISTLMACMLTVIFTDTFDTTYAWRKIDISFTSALFWVVILWCMASMEPLLLKAKTSSNIVTRNFLKGSIYLGTISYSLYLLHAKIYQIPEMFVRQLFSQSQILYPVLTIVGTVGLAAICFRYFEKPFIESRNVPQGIFPNVSASKNWSSQKGHNLNTEPYSTMDQRSSVTSCQNFPAPIEKIPRKSQRKENTPFKSRIPSHDGKTING